MRSSRTDLLIVGAGPFGLAMAAHARHLAIDHVIVGQPMHFWRAHMPAGMFLRSDCDWHLDPERVDTLEAFVHARGLTPSDVTPLSRDFYLQYARWFQERKEIDPWPVLVERLDTIASGDGFRATLSDGGAIEARHVLLALGFAPFAFIPQDLARVLPPDRVQHTCDYVDLETARGRRCLIVGGRQSAFEWAALMADAGAAAVHIAHRHASPAFATSDWSWVAPLIERMVDDPGWFRRLTQTERDDLSRRLWAEGRLKLEPWLGERLRRDTVHVWPTSRVIACTASNDALQVTLETAAGRQTLEIDHIVLATGYKPDIARVPLLASGNVFARLQTDNGLPVLDDHLQSSVPGLFMTSMLAMRDFGPFLAFTVSVRASAMLVAQALRRTPSPPPHRLGTRT